MLKIWTALVIALTTVVATAESVPGVERVLDLDPGPGNPRNSEGDFIQLADGRIMFIYTRFTGSASDFGAADLTARYSSDGGKTWTDEDEVIVPNESGMNTMSVSLLRLNDGRIGFLSLHKESKADCRAYLRVSADEAKTWSDPVLCMEPVGYYVVNNDRMVQLPSGRILLPTAIHSQNGAEFQSRGRATCFLSDDGGTTWRRGETALEAPEGSKSGLQEPLVVRLKDDRLMMLARTDQGCQMRSFSEDDGDTWSPVEMTDIMSPTAPATVERVPGTDTLVMVWNDHSAIAPELKGKRTPQTLAVSRDEGETWTTIGNLEDKPDGWYCYTAMAFLDDAMLLGYCAGDSTIGGLNRTRIVRVPLEALHP